MTEPAPRTTDAATAELLRLSSQPTLSPRPWELIFNRGTGTRVSDGKPVEGVIKPDSLRIVDAEGRLLVRIQADPEQALKAEDMQLIVAAVNALARLAACAERCETLTAALSEAATTSRHLLEMIPADDFSDVLGPEGQHEGEYRASLIADDIRGWVALAEAAPEPEPGG